MVATLKFLRLREVTKIDSALLLWYALCRMNEIVEYLVTIGGRTYTVEGMTRAKAIVKAAHLFCDETGVLYTMSVR